MQEDLKKYYNLLVQWNKKINLSAIDDEESFYTKHVEDSLAVVPYIKDARRLIDLGCGAGIPGIIIKLAMPKLDVTLMEATRKKISFCTEVIRQLDLKKIRAVWGRAEDTELARAIGVFDIVISRAVWDLADFLKIGRPYVATNGKLIAMKGPRFEEELLKVSKKKCDLSLIETHPYRLKNGDKRCLLVFEIGQLVSEALIMEHGR